LFHVVLLEPEIPQNTGNIIRLCANTGATLHLIRPLGFRLDDRQLRRAGLDYHEWMEMQVHESFSEFQDNHPDRTVYGCSIRGSRLYTAPSYQAGDILLFGPETRGLPETMRTTLQPDHLLRIPMRPGSRSLNLANSVAVVLFEVWRQCRFTSDIQDG